MKFFYSTFAFTSITASYIGNFGDYDNYNYGYNHGLYSPYGYNGLNNYNRYNTYNGLNGFNGFSDFGFNPVIIQDNNQVQNDNFNKDEFDQSTQAAVFSENTYKKDVDANNLAKQNDKLFASL